MRNRDSCDTVGPFPQFGETGGFFVPQAGFGAQT